MIAPEVRAEHTTRAKNGTADLDKDLANLHTDYADAYLPQRQPKQK